MGQKINCNAALSDIRTNHLGNVEKRRLFIRGVSEHLSDADMRAYFQRYGRIARIYGIRDAVDNETRKFGYVEFLEVGPVDEALLQKTHFVKGHQLQVFKYQQTPIYKDTTPQNKNLNLSQININNRNTYSQQRPDFHDPQSKNIHPIHSKKVSAG